MKSKDALAALAALAQETRLELFRRLVRAGPAGMTVGELRDACRVPGATLTNHLNVLRQADLVLSHRDGRQVQCIANYACMDDLVGFLLENCCADEACTAAEAAGPACATTPSLRRKP